MLQNEVQVINFSLTGPDNPILQQAIARARSRGVYAIAAIGNEGPTAPPLFPAAYEGVIGVTAVTQRNQVYRLAGQGSHVDFAAPGVFITHAQADGEYTASSGTSLAAPFVSAVFAALLEQGLSPQEAYSRLQGAAEDLGETGFDPVYGFGLLRVPAEPCEASTCSAGADPSEF